MLTRVAITVTAHRNRVDVVVMRNTMVQVNARTRANIVPRYSNPTAKTSSSGNASGAHAPKHVAFANLAAVAAKIAEAIIGKIMESRAKAEEFLHPRIDIPDIKSQDSDPGKVETSTVNQESNQESTISTHPGEVTTVTPDLEQNPEVTTVILGNSRSTQSGESTGRSTASGPVETTTSLGTGVALETTTIGVLGEILRSPASDSSPANSVRNVTEGPTSTAQVSTTQAQVSSENATQSSVQSTSTMRADTTTTPTIAKTSTTSSNLELTTAEPKCRPCSREENATSAEKSFEPGSHQSGEWHRRPHPHGRWGGPPPGGFGGHWRHNGPGHWHEHFHNHTKHLPCCT
ncbi:hypothetical protein Ddc_13232 [Ditylenchus destructor]|nr:hypothetical protein Ddc_13232 [Ditylenchus destructor]